MDEDGDVSYLEWGIFKIAYDSLPTRPEFPSVVNPYAHRQTIRTFVKLLTEIWQLDRWHCMLYFLGNLWKTISPALSLYFLYLLLSLIEEKERNAFPTRNETHHLQMVVYAWLVCGFLSYGAERAMVVAKVHIGGHLRAHFIPRLVEVCLKTDLDDADDEKRMQQLPYAHEYGNLVPCWEFLEAFFNRLRQLSITFVNAIALIAILWQRQSSDFVIACAVIAALLTFAFLAPTDGVNGKGYTFWTDNATYNRLMVLFNIVFDPKCRIGIVRDGLADIIVQEYQTLSDKLGAMNVDVSTLGWGIPPTWYWGLAQVLNFGYPMALYMLLARYCGSLPSAGSLALFQYAMFTMQTGLDLHLATYRRDSFYRIMSRVRDFYDLLERPETELQYPSAKESWSSGIKLAARGLSYTYLADTPPPSLDSVDVEVGPRQMILITGANGSGKTTLVKLLTGMLKPSNGSVFVNELPISEYNVAELRQAIVFLGQSEVMYPVSIKENITMGLGFSDQLVESDDIDRLVKKAMNSAGASRIIQRVTPEKVANPCSINGYSIMKTPGRAAVAALRRHSPAEHIPLTNGEQQRLVVARALFRANNDPNVKLVVLDECTSSLDAIAESEIVTQFRTIAQDRGQTLIVVTHRLSGLTRYADLILCLKEGRVECLGTHDNLLSSAKGSYYSALYKVEH